MPTFMIYNNAKVRYTMGGNRRGGILGRHKWTVGCNKNQHKSGNMKGRIRERLFKITSFYKIQRFCINFSLPLITGLNSVL